MFRRVRHDWFLSPLHANRRRARSARATTHAFPNHRRLRIEPLEGRQLLAVITVDTLADENDGMGVGGVSLRDAIAAASSSSVDTIDFAVNGTITLSHGELLINKSLTINGPGANRLTIDANSASRVINVDDGNGGTLANVQLSGLTLTGGNTGTDGGGILNRETLTVTSCNITGNAAEDGGGIGNFAGTFSLANSTISQNTAFGTLGGGAGIFNFSSAKSQTSTITNSTISNNTTTSIGGGIYNFLGTIIIDFSTITENDAPGNGGSGIATWGDTNVASTQVGSTIVAGNLHSDVDIVGGSVPAFQSNGYNLIGFGLSTGSFTMLGDQRNVADPLLGPLTDNGGPTPTHVPLRGSPAIDTGNPGAVPGSGGVPNFDQRGAPFTRTFDGDDDLVARIDKGAVESDALYFVVDIIVDEEDGNYLAGDFSLREAIGQASLATVGTPTIIFDSSLTAGGPATIELELALGQLEISSGLVIDGPGANLLTIDASSNSRVLNVDDEESGNLIAVKLSGLTLTGGYDGGGGGAIFSQERLTVADSVLTGNTAQWGGAIYNTEFGVLTIQRSHLTGNHAIEPVPAALGSGGALYNWGGSISILDSTIAGNDSVTHGGGILNANGGHISIANSTISNNTATQNGGGISNGDGFMIISNSTITGNHAVLGGGVLVNTPNNQVTTISNSTISGNVAPSGGGGLNNISGQLVIEFCTVTQNVANDFAGSGVLSAPSLNDSPTTIYSSIIAANFDPAAGAQSAPYDVAVSGGENSLISLGYNVVGIGGFVGDTFNQMGDQIIGTDDPRLGPLADNGGPTLTHALLNGSPAIDQGIPSAVPGLDGVPKFDQRGKPFARVRDGDDPASVVMDIGAFEAQTQPLALPGDYNQNDVVDAADYVLWRNTLTQTVPAFSGADGDGNGTIGPGDYNVWRANFGKSSPPGSGSAAAAATPLSNAVSAASQSSASPAALSQDQTLALSATESQPPAQPLVTFVNAQTNPLTANLQPAVAPSSKTTPQHRADALLAWLATRNSGWRPAELNDRLAAVADESASSEPANQLLESLDSAFASLAL